jgi:hypothetical protein
MPCYQNATPTPGSFRDIAHKNFVISMSIYGTNPKYVVGLLKNAKLIKFVFPGWKLRVYTDRFLDAKLLMKLKSLGAETIVLGPEFEAFGMFWRFLVVDDYDVDAFIVRDSDSRLNLRDRLAVEEWISSPSNFSSMRDHVNHDYPLSGGMWGGKKNCMPFSIRRKILEFKTGKHEYMADMNFLNTIVWPVAQHSIISHDSFFCAKYPGSRPFPSRRYEFEHVGQVFDENDIPRVGDMNFLKNKESPTQCRGNPMWTLG